MWDTKEGCVAVHVFVLHDSDTRTYLKMMGKGCDMKQVVTL